jgi:oxygen-independent coproporphyrinogen-3 oxidase
VPPRQRLLREMMLQLKTGRLDRSYFRRKFDTDVLRDFGEAFRRLEKEGFVTVTNGEVRMTRPGLLQVDRLLVNFFEPEYRGGRYT